MSESEIIDFLRDHFDYLTEDALTVQHIPPIVGFQQLLQREDIFSQNKVANNCTSGGNRNRFDIH